MNLLESVKSNKLYFLIIAPFIVLIGLITKFSIKGDFLIALNQYQNSNLDYLFKFITHLGDGYNIVIISVVLLILIEVKLGLASLMSYSLSGAVAQLVKRWLDIPRPRGVLEHFEELNLMSGIYFPTQHSFPSGHTTTAFAFLTTLVLLRKFNPFYQAIFATFAILAGISRVYLLQHFLVDVFAGTLFGVTFAFITHVIMVNWKAKKIKKPLIKVFRKK